MANVSDLLGKVLVEVTQEGDDLILFKDSTGDSWKMMHYQDCCEHVYIESVVGDLQDLVGSPILLAEESSGELPNACESGTWTFYKFATIKGYVDIRWNGESNGYYSESVDFVQVCK